MCKVKATLNAPDVLVSPSLTDIYKYLNKIVKQLVESAKVFVRWMDGTCRECEPQQISDDEEPVEYSFFNDVAHSQHVIKLMLSLNQSFNSTFHIVNKYLESWKRVGSAHELWDIKRRSGLDKLVQTQPSTVYFDSKLSSYSALAASMKDQSTTKSVDFLRIDAFPVAVGIEKAAIEWRDDYGRILNDISRVKLHELQVRQFSMALPAQFTRHCSSLRLLRCAGTNAKVRGGPREGYDRHGFPEVRLGSCRPHQEGQHGRRT